MSLAVAVAQTRQAIQHAQSLFTADAQPTDAADEAAVRLSQGADHQIAAATAMMTALSGQLVGAYLPFSDRRATELVDAAFTDQSLGAHVKAAAAITQQGATQMDAIAASAQQTYAAAARTPAAQRTVVAALRQHVAATQQVVKTSQQQAQALASSVRTLDYSTDRQPPAGPDDQIVGVPAPGDPTVRFVDDKSGPPPPTPGTQPQIGPFPVPPGINANVPAPAPRDPTGGLLTPQNLPAPSVPPNIPGVTPWRSPAPPGPPPLPSFPDLVNKVNSQGQTINDMQNAQHNVTAGGLIGSGFAGCVSGGAVGALPTAVFPPADAVSIPGGCVVGAIGAASSYLATIWGSNVFGGQ